MVYTLPGCFIGPVHPVVSPRARAAYLDCVGWKAWPPGIRPGDLVTLAIVIAVTFTLMVLYYIADRRNISPAPSASGHPPRYRPIADFAPM
jgi:hypothetical protein